MPVKSAADIPLALVEIEAECSTLESELKLISSAKPELQAVADVLAGRAAAMLAQVIACRKAIQAA